MLLHALIDALLGPAGLGDIGGAFPPGRDELRGISSLVLLERARPCCAGRAGPWGTWTAWSRWSPPRILPHAGAIRASLARDLGIPIERVTVKGKTREGLGEVGEGLAVEAWAVALIEETPR